jgi:pimeloyl-ACP methyl ester carboxylesterase
MRALPAWLFPALLIVACSSGDKHPSSTAKSAAPPPPAPSAPEVPKAPPTPSQEVTFETSDKIPLSGTLYLATDPTAPVLVLVHRFRGDRAEWAPLVSRLASADKRYTIVNFDLRGHGQSRSSSGKKRVDWADMKQKDMPLLVEDVHAATRFALSKTDGKARGVVIVGSSLGAAFAARAASQDAKVVAVGLVSPGAAIEGYDVYHPFADVRMLPSFLACAKEDNVCREPIDGLSQMAKDMATVKLYDGKGHGAFGLGQEGDAIWSDLEAFLASVYDAAPKERELAPVKGSEKKESKR